MGYMSKKIKNMEQARAAQRGNSKGTDPNKNCPACGMNVKDLTEKQRWLHIDRCVD